MNKPVIIAVYQSFGQNKNASTQLAVWRKRGCSAAEIVVGI